jgi:predicted nucleic acid-binding protein
MRTGSAAYLVDTNVLVYAYDPSDGVKRERAIAVLERLVAQGTGALSAQVLGEFFVTVTRKVAVPLTLAEAERSVTSYVRSWPVFDLTEVTVLEAVRGAARHGLSYWDALIWAAAKLEGVANVLTEDFQDGALIEGVRFRDPFAAGFAVGGL